MKIGLLQCDHVAHSYLHLGGDYDRMFSGLLPGFDWVSYDVINGYFPTSPNDCDAYLCTGSKYSVYDELPWIYRLKELVQELHRHQKPFVGVCFGHQMLAEALGGKVEKGEAGWCVGVHTFQVIQQEEWMQPFQGKFSLLMSCRDQVMQLPPDSRVLAETADCRVGMFRVGETMLGIQAHPEFSKDYARVLMEGRRERIGEATVAPALESMKMGVDPQLISNWVRRFLKS